MQSWLTSRLLALRDALSGRQSAKPRTNVGRILDLAAKGQPDPARWGDPDSYGGAHWDGRAHQAARLIPDGASVLEIGVGKGTFRDLVKHRCPYLGADLNPLDPQSLVLNIDSDPLPAGRFDYIVMLGVLEYLHNLGPVVDKLRAGAPSLLLTYCSVPDSATAPVVQARSEIGWVNHLTVAEFRALLARAPFQIAVEEPYKTPGPIFDQRIYLANRV